MITMTMIAITMSTVITTGTVTTTTTGMTAKTGRTGIGCMISIAIMSIGIGKTGNGSVSIGAGVTNIRIQFYTSIFDNRAAGGNARSTRPTSFLLPIWKRLRLAAA